MIKLDAQNLWAEWQAAEGWLKENIRGLDEQLERYRGNQKAKLSSVAVQAAIEPHEFEWVSRILPEMAFQNPTFRVGSNADGSMMLGQEIAPALAGALNQICKDTYFRSEAILACLDFQFLPAVFRVEMEENQAQGKVAGAGPGGKGYGYPMRPRALRVSPMRSRLDPSATTTESAAWTGWESVHDRQRLIEHAKANPGQKWDIDALKACGSDAGLDAVRGEQGGMKPPSRDEIALIHIWVRDADIASMLKEAGVPPRQWHMFNGAICTIAISGGTESTKAKGHEVRAPRPFFGPECGPLHWGYAYPLFDKPGGQGPLRPVKGRADALNRLSMLENQRIEKHRRFTMVNGSERHIQVIKNATEDGIYSMPGLESAKVVTAEFGGPTEIGQAMIQMHRAALAQTSSLSPAARGTVTGAGTASENILADRAQQQQNAFLKMQYYDLVNRVGIAQAWYLYHSNRVVQPLPPEVSQQLGLQPEVKMTATGPVLEYPKFYGGERNGRAIEPDEFKLLQFTVDVTSMSWQSDEEKARLVQLINEEIATTAPLVSDPRMSHVNWDVVQQAKARALNQPLFARMYNLEEAARIAEDSANLQKEAAAQKQSSNPPKLSGTVGMPGSSAPQLAKPRAGAGGGRSSRPEPPKVGAPSKPGSAPAGKQTTPKPSTSSK